MSNVTGKDLTQYHGRGGLGRISANAAGVLQLANKNGGYAELAAGTYTLPTLESGQDGFWFLANATGAVTITGVGTMAANDTMLVAVAAGGGWNGVVLNQSGAESGASGVAYTDDNDFIASVTVEGALDEILQNQFYPTAGFVDIPLSSFREVDADGDVRVAADAAAAGSGGVLAADTTPILEGSGTTNAWRLRFATGDVDRIAASVCLPPDFDGTANCIVQFIVSSAGTANSFNTAVLITNWDGGADVTDALTDTATTAVKIAPGTVAAADIPDEPLCVTVSLTPPTHATDALHIYGCRILYQKLLLTT
jgi:hypothetical protein